MENYNGCIIEESLINTNILQEIHIVSTNISPVSEAHETPWLKQWTMHMVEVNEGSIDRIVVDISSALDKNEEWYADLKNDHFHYIIFNDKVFKVDRTSREQYEMVEKYGLSKGIPKHQLPNSSWVKVI